MNRAKNLAIGCLLIAGLALSRAADQPLYDEHADAQRQIREAIREASKSSKNLILDFGANWCYDCRVLEDHMHKPEVAALIEKNYLMVHIDVGRFDKNLDIAKRYGVPLKKGIPALAVLDPRGKLLYAQDQGQFEDARHTTYEDIKAFFEKWKQKP